MARASFEVTGMRPEQFWAEREHVARDFPPAPPHRMESLRGPGITNWVIRGHVLAGPQPSSLVTADSMVKNLASILGVGVTTFVCLQEEMPSPYASAGASAALKPSSRLRSNYGHRNAVSAKPYIHEAQMIAEAASLPQVAGGKALSFVHVPIPDRDGAVIPDEALKRAVTDLMAYIKSGELLYLHCEDGNGRTGSVAALLLAIAYGLSSSEAIDACQRARDFRAGASGLCPETHEQKMQIHRILADRAFLGAVAEVAPRRSGEAASVVARDAEGALTKIRAALARRGDTSLLRLRMFLGALADDHGGVEGYLTFETMARALHEAAFYLTAEETAVVYHHLAASGGCDETGMVSVRALGDAIRGPISDFRRRIIHAAFRKMDHAGTGAVAMDDVAVTFHADGHPDVVSGKRLADDVLRDFLETFGVERRGREVSVSEFEDYAADISACIEDDRSFRMLLWGVWQMDGSELADQPAAGGGGGVGGGGGSVAAGMPSPHGGATRTSTLGYTMRDWSDPRTAAAYLRARLVEEAGQFAVAIFAAALVANASTPGVVDATEYRAALREAGLRDITPDLGEGGGATMAAAAAAAAVSPGRIVAPSAARQLDDVAAAGALFRTLGQPHPRLRVTGVSIDDLRDVIAPPLSEGRQRLVTTAFSRLQQRLPAGAAMTAHELGGLFHAENHASVAAQRKRPEQILRQFLKAFGPGEGEDGAVRYPYFERFSREMSAALPDDGEFQLFMWRCWNLGAGGVGSGAVDVRASRSLAERMQDQEPGFAATMTRLASGKQQEQHAHLAARAAARSARQVYNPAQETHARVIGSDLAASPSRFNTRAGYSTGAGALGTPGSTASSATRRRIREEEGALPAWVVAPPVPAAPGLDDDFAHVRGDRGRRMAPEMAARQYADRTGVLLSQDPDDSVAAVRAQFTPTRGAGGAGGRGTGPMASDPCAEHMAAFAAARASACERGPRGLFDVLEALGAPVAVSEGLGSAPDGAVAHSADLARHLRESGMGLSAAQVSAIVAHCEEPLAEGGHAGVASLGRFTDAIAPPLHPARQRVVSQAFAKLVVDAAGSGAAGSGAAGSGAAGGVPAETVSLDHVRMAYHSATHPAVLGRRQEEAAVLRAFLESFFPRGDGAAAVSEEDFVRYYRIACATEADSEDALREFAATMWGVWQLQSGPQASRLEAAGYVADTGYDSHLSGVAPMVARGPRESRTRATGRVVDLTDLTAQRGWGLDRMGYEPAVNVATMASRRGDSGAQSVAGSVISESLVTADITSRRIREVLARRGPGAFTALDRALRHAQVEAGGADALPLGTVQAVLRSAGAGLSEAEVAGLAEAYDPTGSGGRSGVVAPGPLMAAIVGRMPGFRQGLVDRAFEKLDSSGSGMVDSEAVAMAFDSRHSNDVRSGRKTERQALREFLEPLLETCGEPGAVRAMIPRAEWARYYSLISAGIPDDSFFQLMMWNTWHLGK